MKRFLYALLAILSLASCLSKQDVLQHPRTVKRGDPAHRPNKPPRTRTPADKPESHSASLSGQAYIERYKDIAIAEMEQYGIPASIKLAQALLESGNGNSPLARRANNHFGIKCTPEWDGGKTYHDDDRRNDCFRVYERAEDSFHDHSQFLLRKRYAALFKLDKDDYKGWARGLKAAGYATNPRYADLLISLIERYELYQYDRPTTRKESPHREAVAQTEIAEEQVKKEVKEGVIEENTLEARAIKEAPEAEVKAPVRIDIHEVKKGDTLASIARKYGMATDELMDLNGLKTESLFIGQLILVSQ